MIKLFDPTIDENTKKQVVKVLDSGWWDQGKYVEEFERKLRKYLGCKHVIAVNSGTAALHLTLSLFPQKKVSLPSMSFISTALAGMYNGKEVHFVDIDRKNLCLNHFSLDKDTVNIPVHFGGYPINVEGGANIIEDCAHAMGSDLRTKNIKCFSFHPSKNLAMPNGGAIALYDDQYVDELKEKRWCGISDNGKRDVKRIGWNYKLNDVNAVIGIEQLKKLDENNRKRYKIAEEYHNGLLVPNRVPLIDGCSYHLFWVLVKDRDRFRKKLAKDGIETNIHYSPIDQFSLFKKHNLPNTDEISKHIVTLPIHPNLSGNDLDRIIKSCNSCVVME